MLTNFLTPAFGSVIYDMRIEKIEEKKKKGNKARKLILGCIITIPILHMERNT